MPTKSCCVPGCTSARSERSVILHLFPNPKQDLVRFNIWRQAISANLFSLDEEAIYANYRVCHSHFDTQYQTWSKRLTANSVPTLFLSGVQPPLTQSIQGTSSSNIKTIRKGNSKTKSIPEVHSLVLYLKRLQQSKQSIAEKLKKAFKLLEIPDFSEDL